MAIAPAVTAKVSPGLPRPATWSSLDADAAQRVTTALLQGASPADRAVVLGWQQQSSFDAQPAATSTTTFKPAAGVPTGPVSSSVSIRAMPAGDALAAVDAMVGAAIAAWPAVPGPASLQGALLAAGVGDFIAASVLSKLGSTSLSSVWRGLVADGRVLVTSPGGLGGEAVVIDALQRVVIDKSALGRLAPPEQERTILRALLAVALREQGVGMGPHGTENNPTIAADMGRCLADVMTGTTPSASPCPGGRVYYPAGGRDVTSAFGAVQLLDGATDVLVVDIDLKEAVRRPQPGALAAVFHQVPGDAIVTGIADRLGGPFGAAMLQRPGEFGVLRNHTTFMATTLGAIAVGGTLLNFPADQFFTRVIPPAHLGFVQTATKTDEGRREPVEVFQKVRAVPEARLETLMRADRMASAFLDRMTHGALTDFGGEGFRRDKASRGFPPQLLPELTELSAALQATGSPAIVAQVWEQLAAAVARPGARSTPEERAFIEAQAALCSGRHPVVMTRTRVDVDSMSATATAAQTTADACAARLQRFIAGDTGGGPLGARVSHLESLESMWRAALHHGGAGEEARAAATATARLARRALAIEVLTQVGADTAAGANLRSSPDARPLRFIVQLLTGGPIPDEGGRLQALLRATIPLVTRPDEPDTPWARDVGSLRFVADALAAQPA